MSERNRKVVFWVGLCLALGLGGFVISLFAGHTLYWTLAGLFLVPALALYVFVGLSLIYFVGSGIRSLWVWQLTGRLKWRPINTKIPYSYYVRGSGGSYDTKRFWDDVDSGNYVLGESDYR